MTAVLVEGAAAQIEEIDKSIETLDWQIARIRKEIAKNQASIDSGKAKADGPKAKRVKLDSATLGEYLWSLSLLLRRRAMLEKPVEEMTPEEIDTVLFPLKAKLYYRSDLLINLRWSIAGRLFPEAFAERFKYASKWGKDKAPYLMDDWGMRNASERLAEYEAEVAEVRAQIAPYEAEFVRRGGWSRYILCGANNGHLHYDGCHTLRPTTQVLSVPQASGLDASQVVGRFGTTACSYCFEGAPV